MAHPSVGANPSPSPIVLLVEDDIDTVEMYETYLSGSGYWVAAARNGEEACRAFDEVKPDIVVTDLGLPGRSDGLHVIEHVAQRSAGRIPIILVTGHERATLPHLASAVVTNVLLKPVLPDQLESEVRQTLARARQARERAQGAQRRVPALPAKSAPRSARALENQRRRRQIPDAARCPRCAQELAASAPSPEAVAGYDYFAPCVRGCGRFFRDRTSGRFYRLP